MSDLFERAKTHIHRSEWPQAIACLEQHLNANFNDEIALWCLASALIETGRTGVAAALLRQCVEMRKKRTGGMFAEAVASLGAAYHAEGDTEQAEKLFLLANEHETDEISIAKNFANLGKCWTNAGQPQKALDYLNKALKLRPDHDEARYSRNFAHLELGHWKQGWQDFEARFVTENTRHRAYQGKPDWDGTPGQAVIVWGEQGLGDEIMFASCLPDLVKASKRVIFDCHPRLVELFKRSFPEVEIHGTRKVLSQLEWLDRVEADACISVASLPKFFRNRDEDFPGTPYLKANTAFPIVCGMSFKPRIGIAWSGGTKQTKSHLRSIALNELAPVLQAIDADFYSLQYQPDAAKEICELEETAGLHVKHYPGWVQCQDYDRTASFVASLDLVITVGTAVHHLANALGVPTWTLVPSKPGWRYAAKGRLWYSQTSRFYRQKGEGWSQAVSEVARDLAREYGGRAENVA